MSVKSTSVKEELVECLSQQLSEIELLKSMYPNAGEVILTNDSLTEINSFMNSKSEYVPSNLDFAINLTLYNLKLEVCINLPLLYPIEEPDIYIRCNQLNRQQQTTLNRGLTEYIKNNYSGEVCLYTAITWLQDNIELFANKDEEDFKVQDTQDENIMFCRMWIYSHHIYSKKKRDDIIKLAKEFDLTGFCMPGKPGVISIEGTNNNCNNWWKIVKSMCWQKIAVRKVEISEYSKALESRKFSDFKELYFENQTMTNFSKFMVQQGFGQIFNEFFGFDNLWNVAKDMDVQEI